MNTLTENGVQLTLDQLMPEIFRKQTVGVLERHAKTFHSPGSEKDLKEIGHLLLEKCLGYLKISGKKIDLNGSSMKMLRECLAVTEGLTSCQYSLNWMRGGYDTEWQVLNSKLHGVPQNRERVYTIGHLRRCGDRKIFPIKAASGKDYTRKSRIELIGHRIGYRRNLQTYGLNGLTEALSTCAGGGREHHVAIPCRGGYWNGIKESSIASTLMARDYKGVMSADGNLIAYKSDKDVAEKNSHIEEIYPGVFAWCVWCDKFESFIAIRKLTPRECFRLQGWSDEYFERAQFVNSDSQLYKQAGNGVTVNVVQAIAERL